MALYSVNLTLHWWFSVNWLALSVCFAARSPQRGASCCSRYRPCRSAALLLPDALAPPSGELAKPTGFGWEGKDAKITHNLYFTSNST